MNHLMGITVLHVLSKILTAADQGEFVLLDLLPVFNMVDLEVLLKR